MANVKDGATGTVLTAPSPATTGTTIVLQAGEGARFPTPPFYVIAHPNNQIPVVSAAEKLLVTAISTDTLTVVRAQGIYTAKNIDAGWRISNAIFQEDFNNASIVKNETPGGAINSSNTTYTIASPGKVTGSLEVYKQGLRLKGGGVDYTETPTGFTTTTAPTTGNVLLCDYIVAGSIQNVGTNSFISDETPTGLVNGSNTSYTSARAYIGGSLEVFVNGLKQTRGVDYTETTPSTGTFTISPALATGDILRINYQYNLNPSSNADTIDGIHANTVATADQLYPLGSGAKFPSTVLQLPSLNRQDNTSNATVNGARMEIGWGVIVPGATSSASESVTFSSAFTSAPIVTITAGGDHASSSTYGSGGPNIKLFLTEATNITTGGFTAYVRSVDASNWSAGNTVFYQWIAIGT
jgi:H-type lectin domain